MTPRAGFFTRFTRKAAASLSLAFFLFQILFPVVGPWAAEAGVADIVPPLRAPLKSDFSVDDTDERSAGRTKSNVLFILGGDYMSMKGVAPVVALVPGYSTPPLLSNEDAANWETTYTNYGLKFEDIVELVKETTFGVGALPSAGKKNLDRNVHYGRELDELNNYKGEPLTRDQFMENYRNSYYFPFAEKSGVLKQAYANQTTEYVTNQAAATNSSSMYTSLGEKEYPYALVFRHPKSWENGWSESYPPKSTDLVPNDSSIYQMKLVMWRILSDQALFRDIRFGMAGGGYEDTWADQPDLTPTVTTATKIAPYGVGTKSTKLVDSNGLPKVWTTGTIDPWTTGEKSSGASANSAGRGIAGNPGSAAQASDPMQLYGQIYRRLNLHVPIADAATVWSAGGRTMTQAERVKMWVNGLLDMDTNGIADYLKPNSLEERFNFYRDPEITVAGATTLNVLSIMPQNLTARDNARKNGFLWYSHKDRDLGFGPKLNSTYDFTSIKTERRFFKAGFAEAAGSVKDLFSPPVFDANFTNVSANGIDNERFFVPPVPAEDMSDFQFPITDECENNWVIFISGGNHARQYTNGTVFNKNAYYYWTALKRLYDATNVKNKGKIDFYEPATIREGSGADRVLRQGDLANPVRTLVIGLVGNPEDFKDIPYAKEQMEMRIENLTWMARAGQGYDPYDDSSPVKPMLAYDTESLMTQLRNALAIISSGQEQPVRGAMTETAPLGDEGENLNLFGATYRVGSANQWTAQLFRHRIDETDGVLSGTKAWELGANIEDKRGGRKLKYWNGASFADLADDDTFKKLTGLDASQFTNVSADALPPHKALYRWFQGYDYSYALSRNFDRTGMLSDFGQSGITYAADPLPNDSLPGYNEWVTLRKNTPKPPRLYAQTNDGVLHVVNPENGAEEMAILPPPMLLPRRLAALKTYQASGGKLEWMDVADEEEKDENARSNPLYLLDGPVQKRYFDLNQAGTASGWGNYLIATLGKGGRGLYMLDVSDQTNPKFMWYAEKFGTDNSSASAAMPGPLTHSMTEPDVIPEGSSEGLKWQYRRLGLNSPKPAMGVIENPGSSFTRYQNFIALPGGVASDFDPNMNGLEGASLHIIDPSSGASVRTYTAFDDFVSSIDPNWRFGNYDQSRDGGKAPYMGQMISEPALLAAPWNKYLTSAIFASDNRGNIHRLSFTDETGTMPGEWDIKTIASLQEDAAAANGSSASYSVPYGVTLAKNKDTLWIAGGTADIPLARNSDNEWAEFLKNEKQLIFAFTPDGLTKAAVRGRDWKNLAVSSDQADKNSIMPGDAEKGWYLILEPGDNFGKHAEYVTAKPVISGGTLYVATFLGSDVSLEDATDYCGSSGVAGDSRIYAVDLLSGAANKWTSGSKYLTLSNVKITGLTKSNLGKRERILVTYNKLGGELIYDAGEKTVYRLESPNLDAVVIDTGTEKGVTLEPGATVIYYWLFK
ncbi:MAG: hypothetical protein LBT08_07775 [Synergistaceae bacterium]|jgi:hypothetical protein|nr:hypothetical protein [Synergistaceae bacterium]